MSLLQGITNKPPSRRHYRHHRCRVSHVDSQTTSGEQIYGIERAASFHEFSGRMIIADRGALKKRGLLSR
jgi:hypothetical protein